MSFIETTWYYHLCIDFELPNEIATTVSIVNYMLKHPEMVEYVRTMYVRTYTCLSLLYAHLYYGPMTLASSTAFSYLPTLSSIPPGGGGQCTVCGQSRGHRVQLCWQWYCLYHRCRPDCQRPRLALSGFLEEVPHFWGLWAPVEWDPMERYHTIDSSCVTFPYPSFSSCSPTPTPIPIHMHIHTYTQWSYLLYFQNNPFFIFCESYGGKMNAAFAVALQKVRTLSQAVGVWCAVSINLRNVFMFFSLSGHSAGPPQVQS